MFEQVVTCPFCGSSKVYEVRIDSDWGNGDYHPINSKEHYTTKEWELDSSYRPDVELYHCRNCWGKWLPCGQGDWQLDLVKRIRKLEAVAEAAKELIDWLRVDLVESTRAKKVRDALIELEEISNNGS